MSIGRALHGQPAVYGNHRDGSLSTLSQPHIHVIAAAETQASPAGVAADDQSPGQSDEGRLQAAVPYGRRRERSNSAADRLTGSSSGSAVRFLSPDYGSTQPSAPAPSAARQRRATRRGSSVAEDRAASRGPAASERTEQHNGGMDRRTRGLDRTGQEDWKASRRTERFR